MYDIIISIIYTKVIYIDEYDDDDDDDCIIVFIN